MKKFNLIAVIATTGLLAGTHAFAQGTLITCLVTTYVPGKSSRILQIAHPEGGHPVAGIGNVEGDWTTARLKSLGPVGVKAGKGAYAYAFNVTSTTARQQGGGCGTRDNEAEDSFWNDVTGATLQRTKTIYRLALNLSEPAKSALSTQDHADCTGGLSFFGSEGHWNQDYPAETTTIECKLGKL